MILRLLLRDRPGPATALGVLIGLAGVVADLPAGPVRRGGDSARGLAVLAALSWAVGSLLVTLRPVPADPLTLTTVEMPPAPGAAGRRRRRTASGPVRAGDAPASCLVRLAYLVAFGSLIAFTAYVWLLGDAAGVARGHLRLREPGVAVLLGALIAGERLSGSALVGGLVILAAVALVVTAESRQRRRAAEPAEVS